MKIGDGLETHNHYCNAEHRTTLHVYVRRNGTVTAVCGCGRRMIVCEKRPEEIRLGDPCPQLG